MIHGDPHPEPCFWPKHWRLSANIRYPSHSQPLSLGVTTPMCFMWPKGFSTCATSQCLTVCGGCDDMRYMWDLSVGQQWRASANCGGASWPETARRHMLITQVLHMTIQLNREVKGGFIVLGKPLAVSQHQMSNQYFSVNPSSVIPLMWQWLRIPFFINKGPWNPLGQCLLVTRQHTVDIGCWIHRHKLPKKS